MITRSDIAAHLEQSIRTGFLVGAKNYSPLRKAFTREAPSDGAFELYGDMGALPWPNQNSGKAGLGGTDARTGAPKVNSINAGEQVIVVGGEEKSLMVHNLDWEIVIGVTHNAINDDRAGDLESWARGASINFERHKDYLCFDALNNGAATTKYGACYNGLSFFNDAHIDPGALYQTGQDNAFAVALSLDNFETVKVAASKFRDGRGQPSGFTHSLLIVPPDLQRTAAQITGNLQDYGTADRAINPYAGEIQKLVAPGGWLDTTAWFLLDISQPQKPINLQMRKNPELIIWDDNAAGDGGVRYFKWHARYAVFYGDWRLAAQGNT